MAPTHPLSLFAPGKLFLWGEWAVLESGPALVWPTPAGQEAQAALLPGTPSFRLDSPAFSDQPRVWTPQTPWVAGPMDVVGEVARLACDRWGWPEGVLEVRITPRAMFGLGADGTPQKLGVGSSASVAALVAKAWAWARGGDAASALDLALQGHYAAQGGKGSGADVATSFVGSGVVYRLEEPCGLGAWRVPRLRPSWEPVAPCEGLRVLGVWTGQAADTRALMGGVERLALGAPQAWAASCAELAGWAEEGIAAWRGHEVSRALQAALGAHEALRALGLRAGVEVVVRAHDELGALLGAACGHARVAVKASGAGGGDMALVFVEEGAAGSALDALRRGGYTTLALC